MRGLIFAALCLFGLGALIVENPAGVADLVRGKGYDTLQMIVPREVPPLPQAERPLLVSFDTTDGTPNWIDLAVLVRRLDAAGAKAVILPEPLNRPDPMSPEQVVSTWMDAGLGLELRDSLTELTPHQKILAEAVNGRPVIGVFDTAALPATAISEGALAVKTTNRLSDRLPASPGARGNMPDIEQAMYGLGDAAVRLDADNVVRSVPLATDVEGTPVASVLLRSLNLSPEQPGFKLDERAMPDLPVKLPSLKQSLVFTAEGKGPVIPADANGRYRLYKARLNDLPAVSAEAVLAGRTGMDSIRGRIAVVDGIPFSAPRFDVGGGEHWSRAKILTNALDQIAAGQHVERLSWAHIGETVAMVILGLIIILLAALPGTALMVLFTLTAVSGLWTGSVYALGEYGLWFDPALPSAGLVVIAFLALMFRPAGRAARDDGEEEIRERREPGLPLMVPVLRKNQNDEEIKATEGTVLVCAIRDVERLEETFAESPGTLAKVLKAFRHMATSQIESHGGTVMPGPAVGATATVTALWRTSSDPAKAPREAADCALRVVAGLDDFNASLEGTIAEAAGNDEDATPADPPELDVSIGIASGPVFMQPGSAAGTPERIFGTAVSAATRLEQAAPDYGPAIVVGGKAADAVRNRYALLEIDLVALPYSGPHSGRDAMHVYALMGNPLVRANPRFRTLDEAHHAIFQAYRERKWSMARALVDQCRKLSMAVPGLYDLYDRRISYYEQNPPGEDWTGAFTPPVR